MTDDALAAAQAAALEARAAVTQIFAHVRECERRYQELNGQYERMNEKLDRLIEQGGIAKGRSEQNAMLLGGLPNAFWVAVISLLSGGVVSLATMLLKPHF